MGLMDDSLDLILHTDAWTDDVRAALDADPVLASRVALWLQVSEAAGRELQHDLPSTEELVRVALARSGRTDLLNTTERESLTDVERRLEAASETHPAVSAIMNRLSDDIRAFDDAWKSVNAATAPKRTDRAPRRSSVLRRVAWTTAAAAALVFAILVRAPDGMQRITGAGIPITLADGSTVRLESGAELSFQEDSPRTVTLSGRAFFDVVPSDIPFTVATDDAVTAVLGTSFGVLDTPTATDVTVVTGRVSVSAAGLSVILEPGSATHVASGTAPSEPEAANPSDLAWSGLFIFRDTPIDSVAAILSDAFSVEIQVDSVLSPQVLTGTFDRDQGLEEILAVVASALGASVEPVETGHRYRIAAIKP